MTTYYDESDFLRRYPLTIDEALYRIASNARYLLNKRGLNSGRTQEALAKTLLCCKEWLKQHEGKKSDEHHADQWTDTTATVMSASLAVALEHACIAAIWHSDEPKMPLSVKRSWVTRLLQILETHS